jgi:hypothetical protein
MVSAMSVYAAGARLPKDTAYGAPAGIITAKYAKYTNGDFAFEWFTWFAIQKMD